jgi:DNA-binding response OmpR family regulator
MGRDNGKKVLVLEDEPSISRICVRTLTGEGFKVTVAEDGKVAQGFLNQEKYDLYLFDVRTPGMSGVELYQHLEANFPELANRVVFTTGDVWSRSVETLLKKTNSLSLTKPFTPNELRRVVEEAMRRIGNGQ